MSHARYAPLNGCWLCAIRMLSSSRRAIPFVTCQTLHQGTTKKPEGCKGNKFWLKTTTLLSVVLPQLVMDGERCPETTKQTCENFSWIPAKKMTQQERKRVFKDLQRPEAKTGTTGGRWALAFTAISVAHQGRFHPVPRLKFARQMWRSIFGVYFETRNGACKNHRAIDDYFFVIF